MAVGAWAVAAVVLAGGGLPAVGAAAIVGGSAALVAGSEQFPQPAAGDWEPLGRVAPEVTPAGLRLAGNTSLLSPPVVIPPGAQTLMLQLVAPGGAAAARVVARPLDGGPERLLAVLEPPARPRQIPVSVAAIAGQTVRLLIDPLPAFGGSLTVGEVGPVLAPLPGWSLSGAAPTVRGGARSARLVLQGERARLVAPPRTHGRSAQALLVRVRGTGLVRGRAGGRAVALRASARWRDLAVPLGRGAQGLDLRLDPEGGSLELTDLALLRRTIAPVQVAVRGAGPRRRVVGATAPAAAGLAVVVRTADGRPLGRTVTDRAGRFAVVIGAGPRRVSVTLGSDRLRSGGRASLAVR